MSEPTRLDRAVVARGLAVSRTQAQTLIRAGAVRVNDVEVTRTSHPVGDPDRIEIADGSGEDATWITQGWVGRGALKLRHAFEVWGPQGLSATGRRCLDVGASTGGFTQVLLGEGADSVIALDVGHDQLDPRVAADPRVTDLSGTNIRSATPATLGGTVDLVVGDISFLSLTQVLPVLPQLAVPGADVVLLVKPQFEVGRTGLDRHGVVRSAQARSRALTTVLATADDLGMQIGGLERSPLVGAAGNIEYLLWVRLASRRPGMMDWGLTPQARDEQVRALGQEEER